MLLQGKNAIITGTNRGMGQAMVEAFAANGAGIWVHARKETPEFLNDMKHIAQQAKVEIRPLFFELTDYEAMKRNVKRLWLQRYQ